MNDYDIVTIEWVAGLFEGEGTINNTKPNYYLMIAIQMTDKDILDRLYNKYGGSLCSCKKQQVHHKDAWRWQLSGQKAANLLNEMLPLLGNRRTLRAQEAMELWNKHRERQSKKKKGTNEKRSKIKMLGQQGLTHQSIADKVGVERSYVSHTLRGRYD